MCCACVDAACKSCTLPVRDLYSFLCAMATDRYWNTRLVTLGLEY